ncbi:MAG TPA: hypothetical protein VEK32_09030 [Thermodesulfobacteriota bacterium]|nr:hypothetical protein [Thermodesulfobacteriota bacterium]
MNGQYKSDFKDTLWGLFWVGVIVVPVVYVILQKKKAGDYDDNGR